VKSFGSSKTRNLCMKVEFHIKIIIDTWKFKQTFHSGMADVICAAVIAGDLRVWEVRCLEGLL